MVDTTGVISTCDTTARGPGSIQAVGRSHVRYVLVDCPAQCAALLDHPGRAFRFRELNFDKAIGHGEDEWPGRLGGQTGG
jgi:hypothetical protein